jgi:hypothetical protein
MTTAIIRLSVLPHCPKKGSHLRTVTEMSSFLQRISFNCYKTFIDHRKRCYKSDARTIMWNISQELQASRGRSGHWA